MSFKFSWLYGFIGASGEDENNFRAHIGYNSESTVGKKSTSRWIWLDNGDSIYWYDDKNEKRPGNPFDGYKYYRFNGSDKKWDIPASLQIPSSSLDDDIQKIYRYFLPFQPHEYGGGLYKPKLGGSPSVSRPVTSSQSDMTPRVSTGKVVAGGSVVGLYLFVVGKFLMGF